MAAVRALAASPVLAPATTAPAQGPALATDAPAPALHRPWRLLSSAPLPQAMAPLSSSRRAPSTELDLVMAHTEAAAMARWSALARADLATTPFSSLRASPAVPSRHGRRRQPWLRVREEQRRQLLWDLQYWGRCNSPFICGDIDGHKKKKELLGTAGEEKVDYLLQYDSL